MLVQKKLLKPLKGIISKHADLSDGDWDDLDALARSTIRLNLAKSVYFIVANDKTT